MPIRRAVAAATAVGALALAGGAPAAAPATGEQLGEFTLPAATLDELRDRFIDRTLARYPQGSWAPLKMELTDADLELMGLPSRRELLAADLSRPTVFEADGTTRALDPALISFAGTGWFGIRPGAWLLLLNGGSVGWCSMSHVYGSPGSYSISTAGHCGRTGDKATVIAAVGNRTPVLLDFGKFKSSRDSGIGADYAQIAIDSAYQHLVTPTMAFWGGPRGVYTKVGSLVAAPSWRPAVNPDPFLAQQIVHYGHGTGVGAGGTPRSGTAIHWPTKHYSFFGAITPGDSGSGANTLTGDTAGATMEAAGNITHIYVDGSLKTGLGIMAGTRTTVIGTPTNGQLVSYPVPLPAGP